MIKVWIECDHALRKRDLQEWRMQVKPEKTTLNDIFPVQKRPEQRHFPHTPVQVLR